MARRPIPKDVRKRQKYERESLEEDRKIVSDNFGKEILEVLNPRQVFSLAARLRIRRDTYDVMGFVKPEFQETKKNSIGSDLETVETGGETRFKMAPTNHEVLLDALNSQEFLRLVDEIYPPPDPEFKKGYSRLSDLPPQKETYREGETIPYKSREEEGFGLFLEGSKERKTPYEGLADPSAGPNMTTGRGLFERSIDEDMQKLLSPYYPDPPEAALGGRIGMSKGGVAAITPLSLEEMTSKAMLGTLTVREAIVFVQSLPESDAAKTTPQAKQRMGRLINGFKNVGLNIDMPYRKLTDFDRVEGEKIVDVLGPRDEPYRPNQWPNLQALENALRPVFNEMGIDLQRTDIRDTKTGDVISRPVMYPQLTGETTGRTQRAGKSSAEDNEGTRPMRGTIKKQQLDDIYANALPQIEADEKYGPKIARMLEYHKITSNRPSQLFGLKKSDVTPITNEAGDIVGYEVKGKKIKGKDKKARPTLKWSIDSRGGQIVAQALQESKSDLLFDVKQTAAEGAFKKYISPQLLKDFEDQLPLMTLAKTVPGSNTKKKVQVPFSTIGVIRSIVPHYLLEEFNVREDLVRGAMGHTNTSVLAKAYTGTGLIPEQDIPFLLEEPTQYGSENFRGGMTGGNVITLTPEQQEKLRNSRFEFLKAKDAVEQQAALNKFLKLVEEQPAYDPEKIKAAGKAAGEAQVIFDTAKNEAIENARIAAEADAQLEGRNPTQLRMYTPEQVQMFKDLGMWNDDMDRLTNPDYVAPDPEIDPKPSIDSKTVKNIAGGTVGTTLATLAAKSAKAAGMLIPSPLDPFEIVSAVVDKQMSPEGEDAYDIAVKKGQKFVGDVMGVEPRRAANISEFFTPETLAYTAGGLGGTAAELVTLGSVSGTGPFSAIARAGEDLRTNKTPAEIATERSGQFKARNQQPPPAPDMAAQGFVPVPEARANAMRGKQPR